MPLFHIYSTLLPNPNCAELATVHDSFLLHIQSAGLAGALSTCWDSSLRTWRDRPDKHLSRSRDQVQAHAGVRTASALVGVLVAPEHADEVFDQLVDPSAFGAAFGPTEVHRQEPAFDPTGYWRGGTWPQISYLLWLAAHRLGHPSAPLLAAQLKAGARTSGYAEFWHPDTAEGQGAIPCTWATIEVALDCEFVLPQELSVQDEKTDDFAVKDHA